MTAAALFSLVSSLLQKSRQIRGDGGDFQREGSVAFCCSRRLNLEGGPRHGDGGRYLQLRDRVLIEQALLRRVLVQLGDGLGALHLNLRALLVELHHAAAGLPSMLEPRTKLREAVETVGEFHDVNFGGSGRCRRAGGWRLGVRGGAWWRGCVCGGGGGKQALGRKGRDGLGEHLQSGNPHGLVAGVLAGEEHALALRLEQETEEGTLDLAGDVGQRGAVVNQALARRFVAALHRLFCREQPQLSNVPWLRDVLAEFVKPYLPLRRLPHKQRDGAGYVDRVEAMQAV